MKQKDIAVVILVAFFGGVIAYIVTQTFIVSGESKKQKTQVIEPITSTFVDPDKTVFNEKAINPTKLIRIGQVEGDPTSGTNSDPF